MLNQLPIFRGFFQHFLKKKLNRSKENTDRTDLHRRCKIDLRVLLKIIPEIVEFMPSLVSLVALRKMFAFNDTDSLPMREIEFWTICSSHFCNEC